MTPEQQQALDRLVNNYPDISQDYSEALLVANYTEQEIRDMIHVGFTNADFAIIVARIQAAQENGTDVPGPDGRSGDELHALFVSIATALKSADKNAELEGEVALHLIAEVITFRKDVVNPVTGETITDIDVEIPLAIIEVTNKQEGKNQQIITQQTSPYVNPSGKPVIFFAPRYKLAGVKFMIQRGVPYAKTVEQLDQELKKISGEP